METDPWQSSVIMLQTYTVILAYLIRNKINDGLYIFIYADIKIVSSIPSGLCASSSCMSARDRWRVLREGLRCKIWPSSRDPRRQDLLLPLSSEVLSEQLRQRGHPHWTAWYVPYCAVRNDLWGRSHFNFDVDGKNYQVCRT